MNQVLAKISNELAGYYSARAADSSNSVRVGWKSDGAQEKRFAALARALPADKCKRFSINDFGCGLGDFAIYLRKSGYVDFRYTGLDVSEQMIDGARQLHQLEREWQFAVSADGAMPRADYTVASGIFNLRFSIDEHEWLDYVLSTIAAMNAATEVAFAFNALTKYSDAAFMKRELYYADPGRLFDHCKRNVSRHVALLHDYGEYDFTIIVRKQLL